MLVMADNLSKQPKKGILKNSSSFERREREAETNKETKWDEMNILATLHPADKDYGHMKIEEPKTPFNHYDGESGDEEDVRDGPLDANLLAKKMQEGDSIPPKALIEPDRDEESEEEDLPPEEKEKKQFFEIKRKKHYNEFYAVKLARKLMENDDDEDLEELEEDNDEEEDVIKDKVMEEESTTSRVGEENMSLGE